MLKPSSLDLNLVKKVTESYSRVANVSCAYIDSHGELVYYTSTESKCSICNEVVDKKEKVPDCSKIFLYGANQADKNGGKYIFCCPLGLVYWAATVYFNEVFVGTFVSGPVIMARPNAFKPSISLSGKGMNLLKRKLNNVIFKSPQSVFSLTEQLFYASKYISNLISKTQNNQVSRKGSSEDTNKFSYSCIKNRDLVFKAVEYINNNFMYKLTLNEVASHVFISPSYFLRIFKDITGCTFRGYINDLRIEASKNLIRQGKYTMLEISSAVGFEEQGYFTKVFKKKVGVCPNQFKKQYFTY